jgi:hypothetical protein
VPANVSVSRTARKLHLRVPSALRTPAAGYLKRLNVGYLEGVTVGNGRPCDLGLTDGDGRCSEGT